MVKKIKRDKLMTEHKRSIWLKETNNNNLYRPLKTIQFNSNCKRITTTKKKEKEKKQKCKKEELYGKRIRR